jgi:hypothetical protein
MTQVDEDQPPLAEEPFFGLPDEYEDARAGLRQHLKCGTLGCERARPDYPAQPVHEDTVHPVLCGGCGQVMLCDHEAEASPRETVGGTLSAPVTTVAVHCRRCSSVIDSHEVHHDPVALEDLPASALAALGVSFPAPRG